MTKKEQPTKKIPTGFYLAIGVAIGTSLGILLKHLAIGVALGISFGVILDFLNSRKAK